MNESIKECALREVKEETYLDCKFDKLVAVLNERVMEDGEVKHAFNIFFCKLIAENKEVNCSDEGELKWFSLKKLPSNIIPSDKLMIKELMHKKFCFKEIVIEEKDAELIKMRVEDE
jgi:ADP-ribose pyrophosphatase YjhB (NUDIX family)